MLLCLTDYLHKILAGSNRLFAHIMADFRTPVKPLSCCKMIEMLVLLCRSLRRVYAGSPSLTRLFATICFSYSSYFIFGMNRRIPVAFLAFGSTFLGYAFDVSKLMYQQSRPKSERPKMTRKSVITGRPSACTDRSAVGVRIGASHSNAMVIVLSYCNVLGRDEALVFR